MNPLLLFKYNIIRFVSIAWLRHTFLIFRHQYTVVVLASFTWINTFSSWFKSFIVWSFALPIESTHFVDAISCFWLLLLDYHILANCLALNPFSLFLILRVLRWCSREYILDWPLRNYFGNPWLPRLLAVALFDSRAVCSHELWVLYSHHFRILGSLSHFKFFLDFLFLAIPIFWRILLNRPLFCSIWVLRYIHCSNSWSGASAGCVKVLNDIRPGFCFDKLLGRIFWILRFSKSIVLNITVIKEFLRLINCGIPLRWVTLLLSISL